MKRLLLTFMLTLTGAGAAWAQDYVWVANGSGPPPAGNVTIHLISTGVPIVTLSGAPFNFANPWDIVSVPKHKMVFVSNQGNGTVTVIHAETFQLVATVDLTPLAATNLRGLSVSAEEDTVFVAGRSAIGPAVFRIDIIGPPAFNTSIAGEINDAASPGAEDCVVIKASAASKSMSATPVGDGPGKIYFTNNFPAPGYIGIINLVGSSPPSISMQFGPLANVQTPTLLERTPDHRTVFAGCSTGDANLRLVKIDAFSDTPTEPSLLVAGIGAPRIVHDISFRPSLTSIRGYALVEHDGNPRTIVEIDEFGVLLPPPPVNAILGISSGSIRHTPFGDFVMVGDSSGTGTLYGQHSSALQPVGPGVTANTGTGPRFVTVVQRPSPPVLRTVFPKAGPDVPNLLVRLQGKGFLPNSRVQFAGTMVPSTFIDAGTLEVLLPTGIGTGYQNVLVINPDTQQSLLDRFFARFTVPAAVPPFSQSLPSVGTGYEIRSMPQYASLDQLKTDLASQLGPYNPFFYRVFFRRGPFYIELDKMPPEIQDLAGQGFWILTRFGGSLTMSAPDVRLNPGPVGMRVVPIAPGWNQISLPYLNAVGITGQIAWANVQVTANGASQASALSVTNPLSFNILHDQAIEYVNRTYVAADPLVAGRGYWVNNKASDVIYLIFDPIAVAKPGESLPISYSPASIAPPPPPGGGMAEESQSSGGGCGLAGPEWILLPLAMVAFHRLRGRRKITA